MTMNTLIDYLSIVIIHMQHPFLLVADLVESVMECSEDLCGNFATLKVPLKVTLSAGTTWGHIQEYRPATKTSNI